MKYYVVKVIWGKGKETKYRAPASSDSPERAAFDVALFWNLDFSGSKDKDIKSIEVETHEG